MESRDFNPNLKKKRSCLAFFFLRNRALNSVRFRDLWHYTLYRSFVAYSLVEPTIKKEEIVLDGIVFRIGDETIGDLWFLNVNMIRQYLKKRSQLLEEK
ncbi:hypothetical protein BN000_05035 [Neobacillus massiliamazoniensis]|uniref:Uncharacterized protein n=1 Tax=Neobacillus massiliamazoniensis TaxID=1499688 RepID=A0A0U1P435_9BACI|nr:hypothetical protein BN000_05035 [Neobacillus massiliamazoniensis]